jgi:Na+/H+-dicarboxylate symporter
MARTTVNLVGNCLASTVIAKWEGEETYNDPDNHSFTE